MCGNLVYGQPSVSIAWKRIIGPTLIVFEWWTWRKDGKEEGSKKVSILCPTKRSIGMEALVWIDGGSFYLLDLWLDLFHPWLAFTLTCFYFYFDFFWLVFDFVLTWLVCTWLWLSVLIFLFSCITIKSSSSDFRQAWTVVQCTCWPVMSNVMNCCQLVVKRCLSLNVTSWMSLMTGGARPKACEK